MFNINTYNVFINCYRLLVVYTNYTVLEKAKCGLFLMVSNLDRMKALSIVLPFVDSFSSEQLSRTL